jgi:hypothetical protein
MNTIRLENDRYRVSSRYPFLSRVLFYQSARTWTAHCSGV